MDLTRGDTGFFKFQRLNADDEVITTAPNAMYFTMKKSFKSSTVVVQKTIDDMTMDSDGTWHIVIDADDTASLDYGVYVFDIEVTTDDYVKTIAKGIIRLTAEATWEDDK